MRGRIGLAGVMLVSLVLTASRAQAAVILPLDNSWVAVTNYMNPGQFIASTDNSIHGVDALAGALRWEWTSPNPVALRVSDWLVPSDTFQIWDFNAPVNGPIAPGVQWPDIPGCGGQPVGNAACHWTNVPDVAWADAVFAKGMLTFSPGAHSIAIQVLTIPVKPDDPAHVFFEDGTVIFGAAEIPEPASMLLLGSGLAGLAVRRSRKRKAPPITSTTSGV